MSETACRSDCLDHAVHWRQRAAHTAHIELQASYRRIAESYERLASQATLCRLLMLENARRRGEAPPCCCGDKAAEPGCDGLAPPD